MQAFSNTCSGFHMGKTAHHDWLCEKNLKTEDPVSKKLGSKDTPYYLLCKSHVIEKIDASNLDVLIAFEESVKLRQHLEAINTALKPFFRGNKVVCAGIQAILKLAHYDKSGKSSSLAQKFDVIIERGDVVKRMSLYPKRWLIHQVRRFCCIHQYCKLFHCFSSFVKKPRNQTYLFKFVRFI